MAERDRRTGRRGAARDEAVLRLAAELVERSRGVGPVPAGRRSRLVSRLCEAAARVESRLGEALAVRRRAVRRGLLRDGRVQVAVCEQIVWMLSRAGVVGAAELAGWRRLFLALRMEVLRLIRRAG